MVDFRSLLFPLSKLVVIAVVSGARIKNSGILAAGVRWIAFLEGNYAIQKDRIDWADFPLFVAADFEFQKISRSWFFRPWLARRT